MTPLAACVVAAAAFLLYYSTLLPGVDFGDTGSFQTTVGSTVLTPRVGYPLYFAIAGAFLKIVQAEPARALNLLTALEASLACGLFVVASAEIGGSLASAMAGAALLAVSYTFWSQAVTAEVYALHAALMLASLVFLLRWEYRPTTARLAAFFSCYALAFGNHLSMILLLPGFAAFLLIAAPGGWRSVVTPRVVVIASAGALLGASQYLWNISSLWFQPDAPRSIVEALGRFWFDVTKADWRDTMVLEVPQSLLRDHVAMYWFDLRQQFGLAGPALAVIGLAFLARRHPKRALLCALLYAGNVAFAFSYNVGDAHVFYIPSHIMVALLAVAGTASIGQILPGGTATAAFVLAMYAAGRGYRDYPALDRSADTRPTTVLRALTDGLDDQRAVLLVDLNWQVANGLSYYGKSVRPELAVARARDVLLYAPTLVRDNAAAGRDIVASEQARRLLDESYGPLLRSTLDSDAFSFEDVARSTERGTRYVLSILKQSRDFPLDRSDVDRALHLLGPGAVLPNPLPAYTIVAGLAGFPPSLLVGADRPFERTVQLDGTAVDIRMESWLASDTIRRMGFGHVVANRHHALIVERGVSFAALAPDGSPQRTAYFDGIFAIPRRYLIRAAW